MTIESYIWKDKKVSKDGEFVQNETRLIDMNENELNKAYSHCKQMLYNSDRKNPGRMLVLEEISDQIDKCGAELALRWFLSQTDSKGDIIDTPISLMAKLRIWLDTKPKDDQIEYRLQDFVKVNPDYSSVPISLLNRACRDNLGAFDQSKITYAFLYRLGIFFTPKELFELQSYTVNDTLAEVIDIIKIRLGLSDSSEIRTNYKGLNVQEFTDMIHMKKKFGRYCKYSELTTGQLQTLRHKVLQSLQEEVSKQASMWTKIMNQIIEVANLKKYNLY